MIKGNPDLRRWPEQMECLHRMAITGSTGSGLLAYIVS
jgi:hypothetical protein